MDILDSGDERGLTAAVSHALRYVRSNPDELTPLVERILFKGAEPVPGATGVIRETIRHLLMYDGNDKAAPLQLKSPSKRQSDIIQNELFTDEMWAVTPLPEAHEVALCQASNQTASGGEPAVPNSSPAKCLPTAQVIPALGVAEIVERSLTRKVNKRRRRIILPGSLVTIRRFDDQGWFGVENILMAHAQRDLSGALPVETSLGAALLYSWTGDVVEYDTGHGLEGAQIMHAVSFGRWHSKLDLEQA